MSFDYYFTGIGFENVILREAFLSYPNSCLLLSQLNQRKDIYKWIEYFKNHPNDHHKLFIDSGAFSAWTLGKEIDVEEYITFINSYKNFITVAAAVDNIPGIPRSSKLATPQEVKESADKTWENFLYMRSKMEDPSKLLYTYHVGEPLSYLETALDYKDSFGYIDYIAIGGLVGKSEDIIISELSQIMESLKKKKNQNLKIHLFGMTRLDLLERFSVTSADSTSFIMEGAYGNIRINKKLIPISQEGQLRDNNFSNLSLGLQQEILAYLQSLNISLSQVQESAEYRKRVNMHFYQSWANSYQPRKEIGIKKDLW